VSTRKDIQIGGRFVGQGNPPFIIAEMSGNHNQSLDRALKIVDAAAKAGAHAIKLQTYTADTMTLDIKDGDFLINDPKSLWDGNSLYELYQKAYTPWEWHKPIFDRCCELGLIGFSTPFDETAVDFLESLDAPCYKIASFENTDLPLLTKVAKTGKPVIMATGMATLSELDLSVATLRSAGCKNLILLKCTSAYPALASDANLLTIPHMCDCFDCQVGLSDHTMGIGVSIASVVLGATVIEKHFTLSRADGGVDAAFSLEPHELQNLVIEIKRAWQALGSVSYMPSAIEKDSLKLRRSLYIVRGMNAGDVLTKELVRIIRPGYGLAPRYIDEVLGKKIIGNIKRGTPLSWDIIY
jgi:N-acetylneuraminate synthase